MTPLCHSSAALTGGDAGSSGSRTVGRGGGGGKPYFSARRPAPGHTEAHSDEELK